ncbi:asparagine synthase-related protein, partial [Acinetobacter pittii]|uniref:asparagine synthase-related protein n=2 Tax=Acinetobacter TaxID=469 RepID=UPI0015812C65
MFRYMLEFKKSTDFNSSINYSLLNREFEKIEINSKTNLWLSHPTSSGEIYFFSNAIIIGKLFKKSKNKSSKVENKNKRIINIEELVKDFWGSYIAIIFDNENVEVFKDPACSIDFLWTINNENTIGFSDVEFYKKYSESNLEVNDKYVAASLCYERLNLRETGFKNISNLLSGESITLYDLKIKTIWSPEKFVKSDNLTIDVAMDELRKVVIDCISCWGNEYNNILLNLSGGLDSSLVATILRKHTNTNIYGLNLCFDSELGNEERYARDVSK